MPVAHIGLTVSHLPTSCSFFLAALQPLGYRFLGQWGNQIGLGVHEADFFLTQETPGIKAGAAHVAFSASSRIAVREFYANALQAGGKPHGSPAARAEGDECFNAAVLDLDGNSVEVVFHESAMVNDAASTAGKSRLLTWRNDVSAKLGDNRSAVNMDTISSVASSAVKKALVTANSASPRTISAASEAPSVAPSIVSTVKTTATAKSQSQVPVIRRSFTAPVPTLTPQSSNDNIQISRKTLVGTILGAAAGAAVAYAMCKSEEDSAKAEHAAYLAAKSATRHLQATNPHLLETKPVSPSPTRSVLNASEMEYSRGYDPVRAIEAPPSVYQQSIYQQPPYQHPSYTTVITGSPPTEVITPSRSRVSSSHSPQSTTAKRRSQSSIPSSCVPEEQTRDESPAEYAEVERAERRSSHSSHAKSVHSKPKSTTSASRHSSSGSKRSPRNIERSRSRSGSRPPKSSLKSILESEYANPTPSKTSSRASKARSSVLGRSIAVENVGLSSSEEKDTEPSDHDTVVPEDSVSQIGSSSRRSSRRRHSSPSHRSHTSYHTSTSRRASEDATLSALGIEQKKPSPTKHRKKKSHRSSETGTESTVTPGKYADYAREHLADYEPLGSGSATSMPIRGMMGMSAHPYHQQQQPTSGAAGYPAEYSHPQMPGRSVVSYYG